MSCIKKDPGYRQVKAKPEKENIDVIINNFSAMGKNSKRILWILKSKQALINNETEIIWLNGVYLKYFDQSGKSTKIISDKAKLYQKTRVMELDENVVVYSPNGRKLYTDHLVWEETPQQLHTDTPIRILFVEGDELKGNSLTADMNLNKIIVNQPLGKVLQK